MISPLPVVITQRVHLNWSIPDVEISCKDPAVRSWQVA